MGVQLLHRIGAEGSEASSSRSSRRTIFSCRPVNRTEAPPIGRRRSLGQPGSEKLDPVRFHPGRDGNGQRERPVGRPNLEGPGLHFGQVPGHIERAAVLRGHGQRDHPVVCCFQEACVPPSSEELHHLQRPLGGGVMERQPSLVVFRLEGLRILPRNELNHRERRSCGCLIQRKAPGAVFELERQRPRGPEGFHRVEPAETS